MIRLITLALTLCIYVSAFAGGDTTKSIFARGLDQIKLSKARHLVIEYDYQAALKIYRDLLDDNPDNPFVNYRLGEVLMLSRKYDNALVYLDKAARLTKELIHEDFHYIYGRALQHGGRLDEAETSFKKFVETAKPLTRQYEIDESTRFLRQINFSRKMEKKPVKVTIQNLGTSINSQYDEYGPSISKDSKMLIFTSRRPDTKGGRKDPFDNKYLEDVYYSLWDEEENDWTASEPVKGKLNTMDHDGCLGLTPDGGKIFVYRNEGEAGYGAGDIFESRLSSSGKWGRAKRLDKTINSSYFESSASMTGDGTKLFFVSERKNGHGMADIYMSEKKGRSWQEPVNLGPVINTPLDERMVFIHPNGQTLFFASNGHLGLGGYDIFKSSYVDGKWTPPVNVGYPINTVNDEINFVVNLDGDKAYTSAVKTSGYGGVDIYEIDLSQYDIMNNTETEGQMLVLEGVVQNGSGKVLSNAQVKVYEQESGYFVSRSKSDDMGRYLVLLEPNKKYKIHIKKAGFGEVPVTGIMLDGKKLREQKTLQVKKEDALK